MKRRAAGIIVLASALVALGVWTGRRDRAVPETARFRQPPAPPGQERADEPDAAEEYYRSKRLRPGAGVDPRAAYRKALDRMRTMPVHSVRLAGSTVLQQGGAEASATGAQLGTWTPLGPGNVGGRTRVLVIDPRDPRRLVAAGVSGGLWRSADGGASWQPVGDLLANLAVNSLAMDPEDPDVLYAGTGEGYFREVVRGTGLPLRGGGIFKTTDGGATWELLDSTTGPDFFWVNDLIVSHNDRARVYAATRTGVWRSPDGGLTWQRLLDPAVGGGCLDLALRTDLATDVVFASCGTLAQATVYRREQAELDGPWTAVLSEPGMGRTALAIAPSDQRVVYALAASNTGGPAGQLVQGLHAVFRSTSGGGPGSFVAQLRNTTSRQLDRLLLTNPIAASYVSCGFAASDVYVNMGWYANVIAVDPVSPDRVWAAGVDLFRSDDHGQSWGVASYWWASPDQPSFVHADQHGIVFHPGYDGAANRTMFAVNDGGVFRTDDATASVARGDRVLCDPARSRCRFVSLNHGYGVTQFYHGAAFPDGRAYLGGTQDNGTQLGSDAAGPDGWVNILGGDGGYVAIDPRDPAVVYAESQGFNLAKSVDGGGSFASATAGVTAATSDFLFIAPFLIDPGDPDRLWAGGRRLWRTDDAAASWRAASVTLGDLGRVSALAVAPEMSDRVLAGTSNGSVYRTDGGTTSGAATAWLRTLPRPGFVTSLTFDPVDPDVAYATYGDFGGSHVWRSGDGGATFAPIDGSGTSGLPDLPVHVLVVDPAVANRLFLGTDLGVFVSTSGGVRWAVENTGFANVVTEALAVTPGAASGEAMLFAFTHGRGAWRVELRPPATPAPRPPRRRLSR